MGYCTNYCIYIDLDDKTLNKEKVVKQFIEKLNKVSHYNFCTVYEYYGRMLPKEEEREYPDICSCDKYKWYDNEEDVEKVIKSIGVDMLVKVYGSGEDPGDIWIRFHYKGNTKTSVARIVIDELSRSDLQQ